MPDVVEARTMKCRRRTKRQQQDAGDEGWISFCPHDDAGPNRINIDLAMTSYSFDKCAIFENSKK